VGHHCHVASTELIHKRCSRWRKFKLPWSFGRRETLSVIRPRVSRLCLTMRVPKTRLRRVRELIDNPGCSSAAPGGSKPQHIGTRSGACAKIKLLFGVRFEVRGQNRWRFGSGLSATTVAPNQTSLFQRRGWQLRETPLRRAGSRPWSSIEAS
jgi:hypothetical protein